MRYFCNHRPVHWPVVQGASSSCWISTFFGSHQASILCRLLAFQLFLAHIKPLFCANRWLFIVSTEQAAEKLCPDAIGSFAFCLHLFLFWLGCTVVLMPFFVVDDIFFFAAFVADPDVPSKSTTSEL